MINNIEPTITIVPSEDINADSYENIDFAPEFNVPDDLEPAIDIPAIQETNLGKELAEIGWFWKNNKGYYGPIKGNKRDYEGCLLSMGGGKYKFFIRKPPRSFLKGKYRFCLHKYGLHGWYYVNITKGGSQLERIMHIQEYLRETGG